jgi:hypothetical protein
MKIMLAEEEIVQAIDAYVRGQVNINDDQEIGVEFKASRGDNCMEATLDIRAKTVKSAVARAKAAPRSKAAPEPETAAPAPAGVNAMFVPSDPIAAVDEINETLAEADAIINDEPTPAVVLHPATIAAAEAEALLRANPTLQAAVAQVVTEKEAPASPVTSIFGKPTAAVLIVEDPQPVEPVKVKKGSIFGGFPSAAAS